MKTGLQPAAVRGTLGFDLLPRAALSASTCCRARRTLSSGALWPGP